MNRRNLVIAGVRPFFGVCLVLLLASSTVAQRPPSGRDRTDLINDVQQSTVGTALRTRHAAATVDVARRSYMKLRTARDGNPNSVSAEELSRASLEWFKSQVAAAASKPDAMKAASEYLQREGETVGP